MTKDEAMRLALDALENAPIEYDFHGNPMDAEFGEQRKTAIAALYQALAQPEQEPVGEYRGTKEDDCGIREECVTWKPLLTGTPLYTSPVPAPQRECETCTRKRERLLKAGFLKSPLRTKNEEKNA